MTTWLVNGGSMAHAFSDDEDDDVAVCGYELTDYCGECGHRVEVRAERRTDKRCNMCLTRGAP